MGAGDDFQTQTRASRKGSRPETVRASLRVVHPPEATGCFPLEGGTQVLGRVAADDVKAVAHQTVSRRHVQIQLDASRRRHVVIDLESHNGTRVDGRSIGQDPCPLADQSVVQLGDVSLVYELAEGPEPAVLADANNASTDAIPGEAPAIARVRAAVQRIASDPSPALLLGETGCGKEWIAQELHRCSGRSGPIVAVNCAALSAQIIDSQLFGHVKGAFTGATADHPGMFRAAEGGTLFLDEIGELPLELQPKLLRALQEREVQPVGSTKLIPVDVRVVSATNRDLASATERGEFRRDLYARLTLWQVDVPPLRRRRGDIMMWIERLHRAWREARPGSDAAPLEFTAECAEMLLLHPWQSNLREVDRVVHALAALEHDGPLGPHQLPATVNGTTGPERATGLTTVKPTDAKAKPPVPNKEEFTAAFEELDGNVRAIAKRFARDRRQIYRWIEAHGLTDRSSE